MDSVYLAQRGHKVVAVDHSPAMFAEAQLLVKSSGLDHEVAVYCMDAANICSVPGLPRTGADAVIMGFGVVNCLPGLEVVSKIARCLRPGGLLVLSSLSNRSVWDLAWHLSHGRRPQRWGRSPIRISCGGHQTYAWYRGVTEIARYATTCGFEVRSVAAVGSIAPPPYLDEWFEQRSRLREALCRIDERFANAAAAQLIADMVWLTLQKPC